MSKTKTIAPDGSNYRKAKCLLLHDAKVQFGESSFINDAATRKAAFSIGPYDIAKIFTIQNQIVNNDILNVSNIRMAVTPNKHPEDVNVTLCEHWEWFDESIDDFHSYELLVQVVSQNIVDFIFSYSHNSDPAVKYSHAYTHSGTFTVEWEI